MNFWCGLKEVSGESRGHPISPVKYNFIFTAVKYSFFIFSRLWNIAFLKYALYLINIFLYFMTLYMIKDYIDIACFLKYLSRTFLNELFLKILLFFHLLFLDCKQVHIQKCSTCKCNVILASSCDFRNICICVKASFKGPCWHIQRG